MVTYRGYAIKGRDGEYRVCLGGDEFSPPFPHYSDCERYIDDLPYNPWNDTGCCSEAAYLIDPPPSPDASQ